MAEAPDEARDGIAEAVAQAVPSFGPDSFSPYSVISDAIKSAVSEPRGAPFARQRLYETRTGQNVLRTLGDDAAASALIAEIGAKLVIDWVEQAFSGGLQGPALDGSSPASGLQPLIVQHRDRPGAAVSVLFLDPDHTGAPRRQTQELAERLAFEAASRSQGAVSALQATVVRMAFPPSSAQPAVREVMQMLAASAGSSAADILWIAQPEIVFARAPEMEYVGCPSPALQVVCNRASGVPATSSVGIFCRDPDGTVGLTACYHGTGPVGTAITVGGLPTTVTIADPVQDLVFAPLPPGYVVPNFTLGHGWARADRPPWQGEPVFFDGCTSGRKETVVTAHGPGLLWPEPASQNKIQTPPAVDPGDSGSALIDGEDKVLGFAFRRTRYGEAIPFAEWIWAANALAALELTPI